jgi:hypothetical protein
MYDRGAVGASVLDGVANDVLEELLKMRAMDGNTRKRIEGNPGTSFVDCASQVRPGRG